MERLAMSKGARDFATAEGAGAERARGGMSGGREPRRGVQHGASRRACGIGLDVGRVDR